MGRKNIYFKEKTEREVQELVQIELQNGATHGEVNFSSVVNELVGLGLMIKKHQGEKNKFDLDGFRRELLRKTGGTREGMSILIAMVSEMWLHLRGENGEDRLEDIINQNMTAMANAEDKLESKYFLKDEE